MFLLIKKPDTNQTNLYFMGRVIRFELTNAWFTARCVRPLHHTRQMLNYNNLFNMSLSKSFYKEKALSIMGKAFIGF